MTIPQACSTVDKLETPAGIDPSGKYVVIVNQFGVTRLLSRPANRSVLIFDGDDIYFVDGTDALPFILNNMTLKGFSHGAMQELIAMNAAGRFFRYVNDTGEEKVLKSMNGQIYFAKEGGELDGALAPLVGSGVLVQIPGQTGTPLWLSSKGVIYVDGAGQAKAITDGVAGQVLTIQAGEPKFVTPMSGNVATGGTIATLEGVRAGSITISSVNVQIPNFQLTDGTTQITVTNVNVTVDLTNAVGLLGLDTGAEQANTWYYIYITSDGTAVSAIISTNPNVPLLAGTGHSFYGLASVFRNGGTADIKSYTQKGRMFSTTPTVWGNDLSISTSLASVSSGTPLTTIVPPNVKTIDGTVGGSTTGTNPHMVILAADASGLGYQVPSQQLIASGNIDSFKNDIGSFQRLPILDPGSPVVYWKSETAHTTRRIQITGYTI